MAQSPDSDRYRAQRELIDRIDQDVLRLLNERAEAALEIGRLKRENNEAIYVPERERAVLDRLTGSNPGPLGAEDVRAVFGAVIERIRALEEEHSAH
jgi:chorismate mutase-like protein